MPAETRLCPNCGFHLGPPVQSGGDVALRIISVVALLVVGCPLGVLGGVQLLLAIAGGAPVNELGFGVGMLAINLAFIGFVVWAFRKR